MILPGHRLEISDPELTEGATVEVCIVLQEKPAPARQSMPDFLQVVAARTSPLQDVGRSQSVRPAYRSFVEPLWLNSQTGAIETVRELPTTETIGKASSSPRSPWLVGDPSAATGVCRVAGRIQMLERSQHLIPGDIRKHLCCITDIILDRVVDRFAKPGILA
jgi:hypothetical protein